MKAHLLKLWIRLQSSFWFLPSLMAIGSVVLAVASVALDDAVTNRWLEGQTWARGWLYSGGAEGASDVLGVIAGSMMTIAGVVFSMTLVALTLASSQFGPRLLRNFMRDRVNQWVLGTFVATFLYCLLVLRTIRHGEDSEFVPQLSVSIGVMFALASLGVFIYFIHHVSVAIQGNEIVGRVSRELNAAIDRLGQKPRASGSTVLPADFKATSQPVNASGDGYLQIIDSEGLLELACNQELTLQVVPSPGDYVTRGEPLLRVQSASQVDDAMIRRINGCFVLGNQRTSAEDLGFPLAQLVEIAVRALSPGVNDPVTALNCVDRIGSALTRLVQVDRPTYCRLDTHHRLRVWRADPSFRALLDAALNPLREAARASTAVTLRLLDMLTLIARYSRDDADRKALQRQAAIVHRQAAAALPEREDREAVEAQFVAFGSAMNTPNGYSSAA
jgi:uncharacterized membrane protein